jgi:hypothetical protein
MTALHRELTPISAAAFASDPTKPTQLNPRRITLRAIRP